MKKYLFLFVFLCFNILAYAQKIRNTFFGCQLGKTNPKELVQKLKAQGYELKVLSKAEFNAMSKDGKHTKAELQWQKAVEQIQKYAAAPRVEALRHGTTLHKVIMQFEGWELKNMKKV